MKQLFVAIFIFHAVFGQEENPVFWCRNDHDGYCRFNNVQLTAEAPYWRPAAENTAGVRKVAFDGSSIPVFSDDICKTFTNLEEISARSAKIEEFIENAFHSCANLKVLDFQGNSIRTIDEDEFRSLTNLETIRLDSNRLETLPSNIFVNQAKLKSLVLGVNYLQSFPAYLLQRNTELEHLYIHTNDLLDLDYRKLLEYLPNLKVIEYNANQFSCIHVAEMNRAFKEAGVTVNLISFARTRFYPQVKVDEIWCSEDISWSGSYYRTAFNVLNDMDNVLYTKKEVKTMINIAIEESTAELKHEIEQLRVMLTTISRKMNQ